MRAGYSGSVGSILCNTTSLNSVRPSAVPHPEALHLADLGDLPVHELHRDLLGHHLSGAGRTRQAFL